MRNVEQTIISQFANSPTITRLIYNMNRYIDPRADIANFLANYWNVATAVGPGLDYWGKIVGLPNGRLLLLSEDTQTFGFRNDDVPADWAPFNQGTFFTGVNASTAFTLLDPAFRTLILAKALANITATNCLALNQLLGNLFPGRGPCYVTDGGQINTAVNGMRMTFVFEFALSQVEYAILTQTGVMPHPAGVMYSVIQQPGGLIGFIQAPPAEPLSQGTLYVPPKA